VFAGVRFPAEVIRVVVRWYLRYGLSDRDVEDLLADRAAEVVTAALAFMQNLRRGHHEIAAEASRQLRAAVAFSQLAEAT
jgi:hypothetical protein